ncbi:MAG TPA: protein kinase, partial [Planctomycetota bacterium]|nr:protein kinase [Planctomycetota bacterium]
ECLGLIGSLAARHVSPLPRLSQLLLEKGYISPRQLEMTLRLPPRALAGGAPPAPSPSSAAQLPPEVAEAAESPASRVGKYIRVRALGSGGMGEVWSAWDTELRRWVALKILTSQNREEIARFEREAQTAAKLSHPNIATVYDVGEEGGRPFIAMQLVRGRTLAVFPRDHPRGLIEFVRQAALAVHYAHEQGVVHRDLKPHNIMIEGDLERRQHPSELRVYVMDFGLAKQATADSALSVSGTILGTPSYMPPEQARGLLNQIDARSDVYALGATLYELLTNRPPFKHENVYELLKQVVDEEPRAPRKINPLVDPDLETVVLRCLEKDPRRRYPSARDLADELGRYLAGDPVVARPASVVYRARKWVGRRKALAIAVSAAILAAAAVAGILAEGAFDRARESRELHQVADRAYEAREWPRANEFFGRYLALRPGDAQARERKTTCEHELERLRREAESKVAALEAAALTQKALANVKEGKTLWRVRTARPEQWERLFAEADGFARAAVARDASFAGSHFAQGEILEARGKWEEAVQSYERTLEIDNRFAEAWQGRGICYLELFSEAMMDAQWRSQRPEEVFALLLAPGPRAVECRKRALLSLKRYSELRQGVSGSIEYRYAQVAEAIVQGRFVEADQASDRLLEEVQTDERVWILKAASQIARLNFAGASATLTRLIEDVAPGLWRPHFFRGWLRMISKDWDRAMSDCTRAIELDPGQARVYALRAGVHLSKGDPAGARGDYDRAIECSPQWGFIWSARAGVKLELRDEAGAIQDATRGMELEPSEAMPALVRSQARWKKGELAGALEDAGRAIGLAPRNPDGYFLRCQIRSQAGLPDGALEDATRLVELQPRDGRCWMIRGKLQMGRGEHQKALEDLKKALELAPGLAR